MALVAAAAVAYGAGNGGGDDGSLLMAELTAVVVAAVIASTAADTPSATILLPTTNADGAVPPMLQCQGRQHSCQRQRKTLDRLLRRGVAVTAICGATT